VRRLQTRRTGAIPPRNRHTERGRAVLGLNISAPPHPSHPNGPATWPQQHCWPASQIVNCRAPVSPSNCIVASQPVKLYRRQSARQIVSSPVSHANHLDASQPVKSSRRQSARQIVSSPVSPSNCIVASQPVKLYRRQSAMQIISAPVSPSNHLDASQPVKSSRRQSAVKLYRRQSARQIISAPVGLPNHRRPASQAPKSSWHTVGPPNDRTTTATRAVKDPLPFIRSHWHIDLL
jgi:hypothetical protein